MDIFYSLIKASDDCTPISMDVGGQTAIFYSDVNDNIVLFGRFIYAILCIDKKIEHYRSFILLKEIKVLGMPKLKCEIGYPKETKCSDGALCGRFPGNLKPEKRVMSLSMDVFGSTSFIT